MHVSTLLIKSRGLIKSDYRTVSHSPPPPPPPLRHSQRRGEESHGCKGREGFWGRRLPRSRQGHPPPPRRLRQPERRQRQEKPPASRAASSSRRPGRSRRGWEAAPICASPSPASSPLPPTPATALLSPAPWPVEAPRRLFFFPRLKRLKDLARRGCKGCGEESARGGDSCTLGMRSRGGGPVEPPGRIPPPPPPHLSVLGKRGRALPPPRPSQARKSAPLPSPRLPSVPELLVQRSRHRLLATSPQSS